MLLNKREQEGKDSEEGGKKHWQNYLYFLTFQSHDGLAVLKKILLKREKKILINGLVKIELINLTYDN